MKICIGILAWNEEGSVRTTIHSLFEQSLIRDAVTSGFQIQIVCVPNGCTDNTAQAARGAMLSAAEKLNNPEGVSWKVHPLAVPGKTNAWNVFVHEVVDPQTDVIFMIDADIQIFMPDTLRNMVQKLYAHPDAFICTDLPVKHIIFKERMNLFDHLSIQTSGITQSASGQLCGQLYCARASFLRRFRIPNEIIVDDGFIKKMAVTNLLTEPEDATRRIVTADSASHVFEAYTRLPDLFATLRRQTLGYMVHRWIWECIQEQMQPGEDAGQTIDRLYTADPEWPARRIAACLHSRQGGRIYRIIVQTRFLRLKNQQGTKKLFYLPVLALHLLLDTLVFYAALRKLKSGKAARIWRDTRTTSREVAR